MSGWMIALMVGSFMAGVFLGVFGMALLSMAADAERADSRR